MNEAQEVQYLEAIIHPLVASPGEVRIERTVDERGVLLSVTPAKSDMGQLIGRQGQTARAIRTLLKVVGAKTNARVSMKLIDPDPAPGSSDILI